LRKGPLIVAPGAYDALSARLIERAGFPAVYVSGAGASYSLLGAPDLGLLSFEELVGQVRRIAQAVRIPLVADADTGFGNALNVLRTVREYESAGADAIQLEDQSFPKRCGHLQEKRLIPAEEMAGKIRAACDARSSPDFLIIARTDAVGPEGLERALHRLELYEEAGADLLFLEAPPDAEAYRKARERLKAPLMANMVEGGRTPLLSRKELETLGVRLVIFPGAAARAAAFAVQEMLRTLRQEGTTQSHLGRMLLFDQLNEVVGLPEALEQGRKYSPDGPSP
jgi:carboxyvinyl-carboxyphosphonate phosphorylmutase